LAPSSMLPYDPSAELDAIRELLTKADHFMDKLHNLSKESSLNRQWVDWRIQRHRTRLTELHTEAIYLIDEVQDALLRKESAMVSFHHSVVVGVDHRGVKAGDMPFCFTEGAVFYEHLPAERHSDWREMFRESGLNLTSRLQFNAPSLDGTMMRFYVRCNYHGGPREERSVYIRPAPVAQLGKIRRPKMREQEVSVQVVEKHESGDNLNLPPLVPIK